MRRVLILAAVAGGAALAFASIRQAAATYVPEDATAPAWTGEVMNWINNLTQDSAKNEALYRPAIEQAELNYGLPAGLLSRLLYQESRYRSDIIEGRTVSAAGALGIAQIVPKWHPGVDPLDPYAAIDYAAGYLRTLYRQFGSWDNALAAYNWGPGNVQKHLAANGGTLNLAALPAETRDYVTGIGGDVGIA